MAVSRLSQTSLQNGFQKYNTIWDGTSVVGSYDSLGVVTVAASSSVSSITFSSIPQTYTNLQLRIIARNTNPSSGAFGGYNTTFNGDTTNSYARHYMYGNGGAFFSGNASSQTSFPIDRFPFNVTNSSFFGSAIVDILDYKSTSKYKTIRNLAGTDLNGSGQMWFSSGLWLNSTYGISTITLTASQFFQPYSQFALYGIK
jgi:hypothetical protein